jgi:hypothetical protein
VGLERPKENTPSSWDKYSGVSLKRLHIKYILLRILNLSELV